MVGGLCPEGRGASKRRPCARLGVGSWRERRAPFGQPGTTQTNPNPLLSPPAPCRCCRGGERRRPPAWGAGPTGTWRGMRRLRGGAIEQPTKQTTQRHEGEWDQVPPAPRLAAHGTCRVREGWYEMACRGGQQHACARVQRGGCGANLRCSGTDMTQAPAQRTCVGLAAIEALQPLGMVVGVAQLGEPWSSENGRGRRSERQRQGGVTHQGGRQALPLPGSRPAGAAAPRPWQAPPARHGVPRRHWRLGCLAGG